MPVAIQSPKEGMAAKRTGTRIDPSTITLPTEKSKPKENLDEYKLFLYGEKKIGKTSLAARFPNALHLFFEPGGSGLSTYSYDVGSWPEFVAIIDLLYLEAGSMYSNVIVDTAGVAYDMCFKYVCEKELMEHPSDRNDFGKSWNLIKDEYSGQIDRLFKCGKGVVILAHAEEAEFKTRNMGNWNRIIPALSKQATEYISATADMNAYYGYYGGERRLVIEGNELIEAGRRMERNFLTTSGERIVSIPMGKNADEAYQNFVDAFNNKQTGTGAEVHEIGPQLQERDSVLKARTK